MHVVALSAAIYPNDPEIFAIDRPFFYVIYHRNAKVAIFSGVAHQPNSA